MTTDQQLDLDAIQTRLDALNALGVPGATWQASPRDEKSVIPLEMAHVVEDVLQTGGALLRSSVGVFGDVAHAEFVAHAREDVEALVAEVCRLRARVSELERREVEAKRNEIRLSYRQLAVQAREDRDYEGEATVLQQLADHEADWKRQDAAAPAARSAAV